jgi:hypothetical protein
MNAEVLRCELKDTTRRYELQQAADGSEEVWVRERQGDHDTAIDHQFFRDANERVAWLESEKTLLRSQGWHFPG